MSGSSQYEKPFAIRAADGTVVYEGAANYMSGTLDVVNGEASALINRGEAVIIDATNSVIGRWDYSSAGTDVIPLTKTVGKRTSASAQTDVGFLGVALETFPVGAVGRVAGPGSVLCVKSTATLLALGAGLSSSATAGSVALAVAVHGGVNGAVLGTVVKINQVASPGTGSTTQAGCMVNPI